MQHTHTKGWTGGSLIISALIALPMVVVIASLFSPVDADWAHVWENTLPEYVSNTLLLMLQVAVYTTLIGVGTAWLTSATEFPGRRTLSWLLVLPMAAPAYIVAYIYTDLLDFSGPVQASLRAITGLGGGEYYFPQIRSLPGAALILSLVLYPYVYLLVRVAFLRRSATLFNSARTLGASPNRAFWQIALPAARPALAGGLALVLMETLADFGVVDYFGVPTFSTGIFRTWFAFGEKAVAMKLAAVMLLLVLALVLFEKRSRRKIEQQSLAADYQPQRLVLTTGMGRFVFFLCTLPVLFGALIPITVLINYAWTVGDPLWGARFFDYFGNSMQVALITTLIAVAIALYLTYAGYLSNNRSNRFSIQIATIGYALPGAMLAVGLLAPVSSVDRWLTGNLEHWFGWQGGLVLTGTVTVLIYAYVVRFLTVAYNTVSSSLAQIPPIYSHAARTLGAKPARVAQSIHVPLMTNSILVAGILVFVDTVRELPATLMLRPFNFETLATRVYRLASDERIAEASTASLLIVLLGLIPVLLLNHLAARQGR
ncbi:MAG: iron ABC transporter permease [Pseudomonadota bacterium]